MSTSIYALIDTSLELWDGDQNTNNCTLPSIQESCQFNEASAPFKLSSDIAMIMLIPYCSQVTIMVKQV